MVGLGGLKSRPERRLLKGFQACRHGDCTRACQVAGRLFGVTVERADGRAPVWHPDVQFFALAKDGRPKAFFYLDPYSRPAGVPIHPLLPSRGLYYIWPRTGAPRPSSTWTPTAGLQVCPYTLSCQAEGCITIGQGRAPQGLLLPGPLQPACRHAQCPPHCTLCHAEKVHNRPGTGGPRLSSPWTPAALLQVVPTPHILPNRRVVTHLARAAKALLPGALQPARRWARTLPSAKQRSSAQNLDSIGEPVPLGRADSLCQ